ncbi:MAG: hypothetical protein WC450_05415 [Candidatus Omnitrophota bacterium]
MIVFEIHPAYYPADQGLPFLLEQFKRFSYDCRRNQTNMICLPREGCRKTPGPVLNGDREIVIV